MSFLLLQEFDQNSHFRSSALLEVLISHHRDLLRHRFVPLITLEVDHLPFVQVVRLDSCLPTAEVGVIRQLLGCYTKLVRDEVMSAYRYRTGCYSCTSFPSYPASADLSRSHLCLCSGLAVVSQLHKMKLSYELTKTGSVTSIAKVVAR